MTNVPTLFNLAPGGGDPFDQLQAEVRKAASGVYDILGEMGRSKSGNVVYLAREVSSGHLVAMKLSRLTGSTSREFNLEVVRTLDDSVPGLENQCPQCKALLADWGRFCTRCGADLSSANANPSASETIQLVDAVKQATAGSYEILGKMDRSASKGVVFFARDLKRGKLVALRLQRDASGDPNQAVYSLGETQVFRPLAAELGATQIGTYSPPPTVSPPAPPRVEAPPPVETKPPAPKAKVPLKAVATGVSVALVGIIAYLAFKDSGGTAPPAPPPPPPVAVADTVAPPAPPPADPPPAPPPVTPNDRGAIQIAVKIPPGSRITVDGRSVRGAVLSLPAGAHTVALDAAGFEPVSSKLTVGAGDTVRWRPKLVAKTVAVATAPPPAAAAPPPAPPRESASCASASAKSDWPEALERCTQEAQGGSAAAQRNLAKLYDEGHGAPKDAQQAVSWYTRAAASGDREAQVRLGYIYRTGIDKVKRDDRQSAYFFKLAGEGGSTTGQLEYGVALESGKGVDRNEREAADWYRKAGAAGDGQALYLLGQLYERGKGVQQSQTEAAGYYRQAGDKGNAAAAYALGKLYKDGKGVEKSPAQAMEWFRKAAQKGHQQAANELKDLEKKNRE